MSVLLGIDLGDRRIGVAVGDTQSGVVTPMLTLRRGTPAQDARAIATLGDEQHAEAVIVGLPLHLDGSEGEQAARTRAWAASIGPLLDLPLSFRDERRTSQIAEARLGRVPRGRGGGAPSAAARRARRSRVDREAAAAIVEAELDAREHARREVAP